MKHVLGNHSSSIIKQCLILQLQFTWKEKQREDISTSARGLVAITFKDLLPQATFSNKILSKQDLEELQSFSFHLVHLGMARAGYSADKAAEGGSPCPSPWTGSSEPSRHESTPAGTALLQDAPRGLPALLLSLALFPLMEVEELASVRDFPAMGKPQILFGLSHHVLVHITRRRGKSASFLSQCKSGLEEWALL